MSRLRFFAQLLVKSDFLTRKLFDFYTQLLVYAPSMHAIKQSKSMANYIRQDSGDNTSSVQRRVLSNLSLFRCLELPDSQLLRIGPNHDGGYVIHPSFKNLTKVFSIGVAEDTSFEEHLLHLNQNIEFFLFDHTVTPKRKLPGSMHFYSLGLGNSIEGQFVNLEYIVNKHLLPEDASLLKVDIEGSEYSALEFVHSDTFNKFDQIVIELHELNGEKLSSDQLSSLLERIRANFNLIHIHGNNNDGYINVCGICVPQTLEITFLNKRIEVTEVPGSAIFPRVMDFPNTIGDDLVIGAFKFPIPVDPNRE